jgi:hypothetical protein
MQGWAARYSRDITADFARGFSFAGWSLTPAATEADARAAMTRYDERETADGEPIEVEIAYEGEIAYCAEAGGYLPVLAGLSAYWAGDRDEAVELARSDERFAGLPLFVFPAEYIGEDQDADVFGPGSALVRPAGDAEAVTEAVTE